MLKGEKVSLRAIEREDIPTFVRWLNDPEVCKYLLMYIPMSIAEEERWFERQLDAKDSKILAIETAEGFHIGNIGLHDIDWKSRRAELGIVIGEKAYWGLGYGTDAIKTALRFAFDEMNLHRVYLRVIDFNERAQRCYQKCGFQYEGRQREAHYHDGRYHDMLIMGVLRDEYRAVQAEVTESQDATPAPSAGEPRELPKQA